MLLILSGLYLWHNRRQRENESVQLAKKAADLERKYNSLFVQVQGLPVNRIGDTILPVDSMEDLVKVGQGLLKPINHAWDKNIHLYWVYDDHKRYEYQLIHQKLASMTSDEAAESGPEDGWKNNNLN
jgi:FAD/FMN-containing dehydrogenase